MSRNKRIVGHAIYYYRYSTSYGHQLYIEDVFVKAEMRSKLDTIIMHGVIVQLIRILRQRDRGCYIQRMCKGVLFFTISVLHNDGSPLLDCCCKWLQ